MKRRYVVIALAVIGALAIAAPGYSISLRNLVKKEVAKQISKATGPAGPAGTNGTNGTNGTDGTARAYATVVPHQVTPCAPDCSISRSKGIAGVTHLGTGIYCVNAPGIDPASVSAAVTVEWALTTNPKGNASAMISNSGVNCPSDQFEVITQQQLETAVRNAANDGSVFVAGNAVERDQVSFTIVIP
jgi:hypothetical protein